MAKRNIKTKACKKIATFDPDTRSNGWLLEIGSERDRFTQHMRGQVYLTVASPGAFKGYHLHAQADYFITCLRGKIQEIIYRSQGSKHVVTMGEGDFKTVFLPKGYPHAIKNIGKGDAYVLVYRYPAWNPKVKEQFNIRKEDIEKTSSWKDINKFVRNFSASSNRSRHKA